jgi:hypothetical protein
MAECYSSPRNQSVTVLILDGDETEALADALGEAARYDDPIVEGILTALEGG